MNTISMMMEVRDVDTMARTVTGVCVPYGETTELVRDPNGERILPGAFRKSIRQRGDRILMYREHGHREGADPIGKSVGFEDGADALRGTFSVRSSEEGDRALLDLRDGYLPQLSVGFVPLTTRKGSDGVTEVVEARLFEVSAVAIGAYESADVLAVRDAADALDVMAAFGPVPSVDLSPIPSTWGYSRP
jgi:uncharacterized protein